MFAWRSAINRHFRNFSERQKDFKKIERKSVDAKVEVCLIDHGKAHVESSFVSPATAKRKDRR